MSPMYQNQHNLYLEQQMLVFQQSEAQRKQLLLQLDAISKQKFEDNQRYNSHLAQLRHESNVLRVKTEALERELAVAKRTIFNSSQENVNASEKIANLERAGRNFVQETGDLKNETQRQKVEMRRISKKLSQKKQNMSRLKQENNDLLNQIKKFRTPTAPVLSVVGCGPSKIEVKIFSGGKQTKMRQICILRTSLLLFSKLHKFHNKIIIFCVNSKQKHPFLTISQIGHLI